MKFFYLLLLCSCLIFQWTHCILKPYLKYIKPKIKADDLELLRSYKYMAKGLIGGYIIGALQHSATVNLRHKTPVSFTLSLGKKYQQDKPVSKKYSRNSEWEDDEDDCENKRIKASKFKKESLSSKHIIFNDNPKSSIIIENSDMYPIHTETIENSDSEDKLEKINIPYKMANQESEEDINIQPNGYSLSNIYTYKDVAIPLYDSNIAESNSHPKFANISINNEEKDISNIELSTLRRFENWKDIGAYERDYDKEYLKKIDFSEIKTQKNKDNTKKIYDIDDNDDADNDDYDDYPKENNHNNSDNEKRIYDNNNAKNNTEYNFRSIQLNNNNNNNDSINLTKQFEDKLKIEKLTKEREMANLKELKAMFEMEKRNLMKIIKKTHHVIEKIKRHEENSSQLKKAQASEIKFDERLSHKRFPILRTYRRSYIKPTPLNRNNNLKMLIRMETVRLGPTQLAMIPPFKNYNPSFLSSSIPIHSSFIHSQPFTYSSVNL